MRLRFALIVLPALAACGGPEPVAEEANNFANAEIEILPADESAATSSEDLNDGVTEPTAAENAAAEYRPNRRSRVEPL